MLRLVVAFLKRDLMLLIKSPERFLAVVFFAMLLMVLASFAFTDFSSAGFGLGFFWLLFAFTSLLSFQKILLVDELTGFSLLIALSGASPTALFLAKNLSACLFLNLLHILLLLLSGLLFSSSILANFWPLLGLILLLNWGQVAVGTLVAEKTFEVKYSEFLFPLFHLPLTLPLFLAGLSVSEGAPGGSGWWLLILLFDLLFSGLHLAWGYLVD